MPPELYCLVPPELADELVEPLQAHYAGTGVRVIVDRRDSRRRASYAQIAQRHHHLPRSVGELPQHLAGYAEALRVVQRMAPAGPALADRELLDVVDLAAAGDAIAATELTWRIYHRVQARVLEEEVDSTLGRILDALADFRGNSEREFHRWLVCQIQLPPAMAGRMTSVSLSDTPV